jgi:hypothetical protein
MGYVPTFDMPIEDDSLLKNQQQSPILPFDSIPGG